MKILFLFSCIVVFFLIASFASATDGPKAYLYEIVKSDFDANGSYSSDSFSPCTTNPCAAGWMKVSVPNSDDVLQYLRIGVTSKNNTNLDDYYFFRDTLTSYPTADSQQTVNCNTTASSTATWYNVSNLTAAPPIKLEFRYSNYQGGNDTVDDDDLFTVNNTLNFTIYIQNPSNYYNISNVNFTVYFDRNTYDEVDITTAPTITSGYGTVSRSDSNSNGMYDRITWTNGYIPPSTTITIQFNVTINDTNFVESGDNTYINLDDDNSTNKGVVANHINSSSTLSMISINNKTVKASIRQGIDMVKDGNGYWRIRGFIENIANSSVSSGESMLTYNVSHWYIYSVNPSTGAPYSTPNMTGAFNKTATANEVDPNDGRIYTTDSSRSSNTTWFNSSATSKPYFAVSFNWSVIWDTTDSEDIYAYINSTLDMPTIYKIDITNTGTDSGIINPDTGGDVLTINHTTQHTGNSNIKTSYIEIYADIPSNNTAGDHHGVFVLHNTSIEVWYYNDSWYKLDLTDSDINVTSVNATETSNGYINITIFSLKDVDIEGISSVGHNLGVNDKIMLRFQVVSNESMTTGDTYNFTGNATHYTESGTPIKELLDYRLIQVSATRLTGYKDLFIEDPSNPTIINVSINVSVEDQSGNGVSGIKFIDYVPVDALYGFDLAANATVYIYNDTGLHKWTNGTEYNITYIGNVILPDGTNVTAYEFINGTGGDTWKLEDGWFIYVTYQMNVTQTGTYILPCMISGFDPATGLDLSTSFIGSVRVTIPEISLPIQITEEDLQLSKTVVVGKPALWMKTVEVYNPNPRPAKAKFSITVFEDTMDAHVNYYNDEGEKVEEQTMFGTENGNRVVVWETVMQPMETRTYEISILTPPVMEIDRDVEVLEKIEEKLVKLKMDVYLKSFAKEDYTNIRLNMPIPYDKIIRVADGFGNPLQFTGGAGSCSIAIPDIEAEGMKTVTIIYQESYPVIIITPDRDRYDLNSPANLEILVINGGEKLYYPHIETEVYTPFMDVVYSSIQSLDEMDPLEKTELYEKFMIPAVAPSGKYIANVKFREGFSTVASGTGYFTVMGIPPALNVLDVLILILIIALLYFSAKRIRILRLKGKQVEGGMV